MAGLVPAIHVLLFALPKDVDAGDKRGHDVGKLVPRRYSRNFSANSTMVLR
jgi:hypothetical protein